MGTAPTASHSPLRTTRNTPLTLWHLLSLDAPTVATLWTWFIARANHIQLPIAAILAMFLAVWTLYAADRLLDDHALEARHHFHHHHRKAFLTGIVFTSIALAILLPRLEPAATHLYLILGGLVFGYFVLIHATQNSHRYPKELAVGICFAAATFIPTVARQPTLRPALLPPALLFAALCSLNCLFIYAWEHAAQSHPLPLLAITLTLTAAAVALFDNRVPWPIPAATSLAAAFLLALHQRHQTIGATTLRAAADLALLTPILLLPFIR
jgi:F0F1-type ATP synthase membrane subunit c/vacuolar-type H+-ATPase subunit K